MNRTTTLLLSLFLVTGAAQAVSQYEDGGGSAFSVDELTFNLDWDDQQFGWSQADCLDLGVGDTAPSECRRVRIDLDDEEHRNHPPSTNQMPTKLGNGQ